MLPLITLALFVLLITVEVVYRQTDDLSYNVASTIVNAVSVGWFIALTVLTRCFVSVSNLVCPSLVALLFYYMIWIDYDEVNISIFYKTVVGITIQFFLLVTFNESWLLTSLVYIPFCCYFMFISGNSMLADFNGSGEITARCLFCSFIFTIVAYKMERLNKQSFLGRDASQQVFFKWLKIFDTFPEGLALIKNGRILYANQSLGQMLELHEYVHEDDENKAVLKNYLKSTKLIKLDREIMKKQSVWDFLESKSNGGAFELHFKDEEGVPIINKKHNFMPLIEGQTHIKYISLNKVNVSVLGGSSQEQLFIVRDLTTMVNLQKVMLTREHFN